jgi:hypothetical protein
MDWRNKDEGFGKELECRAVSGVCVLSWILLVEQLTNNGLTLALRWPYTGQTTGRRWTYTGPILELHSINSIASIAASWKDAIARLVFWAEVDKKCFI